MENGLKDREEFADRLIRMIDKGDITMQLEGVGSSIGVKFSSSNNVAAKEGISENRVGTQDTRVRNQNRRSEETKYVEEKRYSEDEVIDIIETANKEFVAYDRKFEFSIHEKTKQIMVKVLDSVTNEVIRELPPEKVLDIVAGLWEVAGIMVDRKI